MYNVLKGRGQYNLFIFYKYGIICNFIRKAFFT